MNAIIARNCDLRLAHIIALLLEDSPRIELTYYPDEECYTLNAGPNDYLMHVDSDDFCFVPMSHNDADHAYTVSFSMPRFLRRD